MAGDLVVFAGAGASTESRLVLSYTLYDEICGQLEAAHFPPFPRLMQEYQDRFGRPRLLQEIKKRIDYMKSFPELDGLASCFHRELATVFPVDTIFTTNWDDYFERECAATAFVTEQDWGYWRSARRKVFKLHGSIENPGSIIATERDYQACYRRLNSGLLGATLKTILATKTVVFVGYSFGDSDFNAIYRVLHRSLGDILPRAYIVTLDEGEPPTLFRRLQIIRTDATHFVRELKAALPGEHFLPDDRFEHLPVMAMVMTKCHTHMLAMLSVGDHSAVVHCASYQDGLIHAFEHQIANRRSGEYSHTCHVEAPIELYESYYSQRIRSRSYYDAAYVHGYLTGMEYLLADDEARREGLPYYFVFGYDGEPLQEWDAFLAVLGDAATLHKSAHAQAKRIARKHGEGVVVHHPPMLGQPLPA